VLWLRGHGGRCYLRTRRSFIYMGVEDKVYKFEQLFEITEDGTITTKVPMSIAGTTVGPGIDVTKAKFGNTTIQSMVDQNLKCYIQNGIVAISGIIHEIERDPVKCMTVADLIVILAELDPTMEVVIPQAPYGEPWPLPEGFVNAINIDAPDSDFGDLEGTYCGIGFGADAVNSFCESDDLEDDPTFSEEQEHDENDVVVAAWHDSFVPGSAEDVKNILDGIDEDEEIDEYDDDAGFDHDAGEED